MARCGSSMVEFQTQVMGWIVFAKAMAAISVCFAAVGWLVGWF